MGAPKALLDFHGEPLAHFLARQVEEAAGSATLIGDPQLLAPLDQPVIADLEPHLGPLGGIYTALAHTSADLNLIVACDLVNVRAAFLRELLDRARESSLFVPEANGEPQPLCAIYHRSLLPAVTAAVNARQLKVRDLLNLPGACTWSIENAATLANVNTPEDWVTHVGCDLALHRVPPSQ
jgi:molybdopterin-guanine dinucleotide biosynthesis protein A